jgi:hypothetical protein
MRFVSAVAPILVVTCCAAVAKEANVGGTSLNLIPPAGYCDLDESNPSDGRLITAIGNLVRGGGNELLAISANCGQLSDWRAGKRPLLDDIAQYQSPISMMQQTLPGSPEPVIKQNCDSLRKEGERLLSGSLPDIKSRVEKTLERVKISDSSFMGVLAEDATACYAAVLQKMKTEIGTDKTQVALFAITVVKGKMIFSYLFSPFAGTDTVTSMLTAHKANVAALLAANRN